MLYGSHWMTGRLPTAGETASAGKVHWKSSIKGGHIVCIVWRRSRRCRSFKTIDGLDAAHAAKPLYEELIGISMPACFNRFLHWVCQNFNNSALSKTKRLPGTSTP